MLFAIGLVLFALAISYRLSPHERKDDAQLHGAGQIGLLAAVALFGSFMVVNPVLVALCRLPSCSTAV